MSLNSGQGVGLEKITSLPRGGGGEGGAPDLKLWGGRRTFFDLTFLIVGYFFRLRKFGNSFFGWLDLWWCLHIVAAKHKHLISNLLFVLYNLMLS